MMAFLFTCSILSSYVQHAKVNQWTNGVVESCLASLTKLQKPFKYIVTCVIMQVSTHLVRIPALKSF